jgi:cation:H+ antiporter
MFLNFIWLLLGGAMLYFGAEWFVRGAAGLAFSLGVRPLLIGLTVVSYATSAPELAVSMFAAFEGKSEIALGNVVGSNIANIGLILGLTALIAPPRTDGSLISKEIVVLLVATLALPLTLLDGQINRIEALAFLLGATAFTYLTVLWSRQRPLDPDEVAENPTTQPRRLAVLLCVGLTVLLGGGKLFVDGAVELAHAFGMSERVVGLTVVALGTSVPELAASLVAALRGHSELAIGNVIGSNVFNLLLILGATGSIFPILGDLSVVQVDLWAMIVLTVFLTLALRTERVIPRWEGALMVAAYLTFLTVLVMQRGS